jgi:hypothetical protein
MTPKGKGARAIPLSFLGVLACIVCIASDGFSQAPGCGDILGMPYKNVAAYSNGVSQWTIDDCDPPPAQLEPYGMYGDQFQCVEYVKRFYYEALGVTRALHWTGNAVDYFYSANTDVYNKNGRLIANDKMLTAFQNGSSTPPRPDDILVFGGHGVGHVAIVGTVTDTEVIIIEQNWSIRGTYHLLRRATTDGYFIEDRISRPASDPSHPVAWPIIGWLREDNSPPAHNAVALKLSGVVTEVVDPTGVLGNTIPLGSIVSGTFSYELNAPDYNPTDPTDGRYCTSQPLSITFNTPTGPIVVSTVGVAEVDVANDSTAWGGGDGLTVVGLGSPATWNLPLIKYSEIALQAYNLTVPSSLVVSDHLPTTLNLGGAVATGFVRTNYIVSPKFFDNLYSVSFIITGMTFELTDRITPPIPPGLITVDGDPNDWAGILPIVQDSVGDVDPNQSLDIKNVLMTNDATNLYVLVEYEAQSARLNPLQGLQIYLDLESNVGCRSWPFCMEGLVSVNLHPAVHPAADILDMREGGSGRLIPSSILSSYAVNGRFVELGIPFAELRRLTMNLSRVGFYLYAGIDNAGVTSNGAASYTIR